MPNLKLSGRLNPIMTHISWESEERKQNQTTQHLMELCFISHLEGNASRLCVSIAQAQTRI